MDSSIATPWEKIKGIFFHCFPHHLLSRLTFWVTRQQFPFTSLLINAFIKSFNVDLQDAVIEDIDKYNTFNDFFTRELKPGARPIDSNPLSIISPCDGKVSLFDRINENTLLQAKNKTFTLNEFLTPSCTHTAKFNNGSFYTIYLSPRDYHRVHMSCDARLLEMIYVPGRLFSVAPYAPKAIDKLYARNERVISIFKTAHGYMASVMVGAVNVAAIETSWAGLITPPHLSAPVYYDYSDKTISLNKGDEMGIFNMGSTVVLLFSDNHATALESLGVNQSVKMGQSLATIVN